MFESVIASTSETSLSISSTILSMVLALVLGLVVGITYMITAKKKGDYSTNFVMTLTLLPCMVAVVILLVGTNVARAFSIAGIFSLVRFRSVPGDSKDISFVFFVMAIGLSIGMGFLTFAATITVFIALTFFALSMLGFAKQNTELKELKITVPENMNFQGAFDDLLEKNTEAYSLDRIKTTNMGTLYELTFQIQMKMEANEKELIDAIRCRNGNLVVVLCKKPQREGIL